MNPYFTPNYTYSNNQFPQFAYSQAMGSQQTQPYPQSGGSIQSMYTTVQPYNNKQFLASTFGNKLQYIQIFLTLSHEDKLKMYLLMQQKKLYGDFTDKDAYQKILKQIAQKLQNYHAFYQTNPKTNNTQPQSKHKDLESKIDSFCQLSFQKLNVPKIGLPNVQQPQQQEVEQQWVQSAVEQGQEQKQTVIQNKAASYEKAENEFNSFYTSQSNKQNVKNSASYLSSASPVFNIFNVDYEMERAMTKEIGLKKASQLQKMSIWELEVQQAEVKKYQPNLHEVFKKKQQVNQNKPTKINAVPQPTSSLPYNINSFDLYSQYVNHQNTNSPPPQISNGYLNQFTEQQTEKTSVAFQNFQFNYNGVSFDPQTLSKLPEQTQQIQVKQQVPYSYAVNLLRSNQQQQWEQGFQEGTQNNNQQSLNIIHQYNPQPILFDVEMNVKPFQANDNLFDFDTFDVKVVQPIIDNQVVDLYLSSTGNKQQAIQQELLLQQNGMLESPREVIQTVVDLQAYPPSSNLNSQLFLPDNQQKYQIIDHLKIQLGESHKAFLTKQLRNKSFQCNTQFYLTIINYLRDLSLQHTPQFQHFNEQYRIVKSMHEVSSKYTTVVDEEDEEKVQQALRESKKLYNQIYNNSNLTQKYAQSMLSQKNKEKGIQYKLGRVLIDSCINIDLIIRASSQQNKKNVFNSFCLLYILEKTNSLSKLKNYAQLVIAYTNQQIDQYKLLSEDLLGQAEEQSEEYPNIIVYIKGLLKIVFICERLINLIKNCFIKIPSNIVKTLKNCKDIKNRFGSYIEGGESNQLFPSSYGDMLRQGVQKNRSLYDLHIKFQQASEKKPICLICLSEIGQLGDEQKGWYHYSCFNLIKSIGSLDQI